MVYYLDYSNGTIGGQAIKDAEYGGVIRYITSPALMQPPNPGNPKHYTRTEYESHKTAGLDIWCVYQGTTTDADGGFSIGVRNAQRALQGCTDESGIRQGPIGYNGVVFFTNDRTTLPDAQAWRAYLDGAASVLGFSRVGAYGFGNAMDAAQGHAYRFWQAGSRSQVRPFVHFWQDNNVQVTVAGKTCDRNLVLKQLYPDPPPFPPVEEHEMQLDDVVGVLPGNNSFTVRDVLTKEYLRKEVQCLPVEQRDRFNELCNLLYTLNGQSKWSQLAGNSWADMGADVWAAL